MITATPGATYPRVANLPAAGPSTPAGAAAAARAGVAGAPVHVRLLGINDFHGQLGDNDAKIGNDAVGGAATLAAYLNRARAENPSGTVLLSAGDAFGASPPESTLLHHESTLAVLAGMGLDLATFGNHEFDEGVQELMRLVTGGSRDTKRKPGVKAGAKSAADAPPPWPGTPFGWLSANVVSRKSGKPIAPPYAIMQINGVKVGFVGAVTKNLPNLVDRNGIRQVKVLDPAEAINKYVPELKAKGVKTIVAFVHEGGEVNKKTKQVEGPIVPLVKKLDREVDVVMSAHSHQQYSTKIDGRIVTQGLSYAKAFSQVDLMVDPRTGDVVGGTSQVVKNLEKNIAPDPLVDRMVKLFKAAVAPKTERVVSVLPGPVTRDPSPAGESALGTLIAESQRQKAGAQVALMNPGGIRTNIEKGGPVKWGTLFSVQPFSNQLVKKQLTGAQLRQALEQMFRPKGTENEILQVAGMRVTYDMRRPLGRRIVSVQLDDGTMLDPRRRYSVAMNKFLADGGDGFTAVTRGRHLGNFGLDVDALAAYLRAGKPVPQKPIGRLTVVGGKLPAAAH